MVATWSAAMLPIVIVLIVFGSVLAGLGIVAWTVVRLTTGGRTNRAANADDSRAIQEMYQGLSRMERRIEALETLLLERERKGERS